jgi:hypothetical protein
MFYLSHDSGSRRENFRPWIYVRSEIHRQQEPQVLPYRPARRLNDPAQGPNSAPIYPDSHIDADRREHSRLRISAFAFAKSH